MINRIVIPAILASLFGVAGGAAPLIYGTAYSGSHKASTLYSISASNGIAKAVGDIGFNQVGVLAFAPNGTLFGVGRNGADKWVLLKIDLVNGAGTAVGPTGLDSSFQDIAFRSDGTLFGYTRSSGQKAKTGLVYSLDTSTGSGRLAGNVTGGFEDSAPVAFSSQSLLYTVNQSSLGTIASTNASSTTPLHYSASFGGAQPQPSAMKFDSSAGMLWALASNNSDTATSYLTTIDVKTGNVAAVGQTSAPLHALALQPRDFIPPGPLPSSVIFLISGILALLCWNFWMRSRGTANVS